MHGEGEGWCEQSAAEADSSWRGGDEEAPGADGARLGRGSKGRAGVLWVRGGVRAAGVLLALLLATGSQALSCYSHADLPFNIKPFLTEDCETPLGFTTESERVAQSLRTDEQAVANLPTCYRTCQGTNQIDARCSYSCTRWASCQMMLAMGDTMNEKEKTDTSTDLFPLCILFPEQCRRRIFVHECCILDNYCNGRAARSASLSFGAIAAMFLAWGVVGARR